MNILDPKKARALYREFSYGRGVRESARLVGCNRGTAARYRREWLRVRFRLQQAYDELWEHNCEACDSITETLPDEPVTAMLDVWLDDQDDKTTTKSGFYHGYES